MKKVELRNFRNYEIEKVELEDGFNFIIGKNAQGKTNLLEAIYLSAYGKSFRTNRDNELCLEGRDTSKVKLEYLADGRNHYFTYEIERNKKKMTLDNDVLKNRSELFGNFSIILFTPENLKLIREGPSVRRKFIDRELSFTSKSYYYNLVSYNRVLAEKGAYLKGDRINMDLLDIYNQQLAKYGSKVIEGRLKFIKKINDEAKRIHHILTGEKELLEIRYASNLLRKLGDKYDKMESGYYSILDKLKERDMETRSTNIGPHLDDLHVTINERDVRTYGSQGQVRLSSLSVFFSLVRIIEEETGKKPIVLLDDVYSELDHFRRNKVNEFLYGLQVIVTSTDLGGIDIEKISGLNILSVDNGIVSGGHK